MKEKFIGSREFYARVLTIAVPIMVQNGITNFVSLLDNIMVGQLGTEPMSGVSIVNQLIFVYSLCIFGGLAGAGIFTAQYYGQGDHEGIRHTFRYKLWLGLIVTAGALWIFMIFGKNLIQLYLNGGGDGEDLELTLECGITYLRVMLAGLPAFMILQVYASTLRECGETVVPMRAALAQCYSVRGLAVVAALNIANTINNLFNVVYSALGESVAIIVGQILGAGKMKEARDADNKMIVFSILSGVGAALLMLAMAPLFPKLYNTTDGVRAAAAGIIIIQAVFMPQNAFLNAAYFTLRAGGKTVITFFFDCVCIWGISVPLAYVLARYTSMNAVLIFVFVQVGEWVKCVVGFVLVKKGVWIQNIISD